MIRQARLKGAKPGAASKNGKPESVPTGDYGLYSASERWIIMIAVMLGTIMEILDTSIVNVAIPDMMGNLGATVDQIGWVSTGYIIANVIVLPLTGWLSNHFGRRRYLAGSMILFTAASFLCGTAHSLDQLIIYRILQGAGGAALISTAQATLLEVFPPKQVAAVQAIFTIGVVTAPTLGPTLGGFLTDQLSWPWIFFVNIPIGILATFLVLTFLRDSKYQQARTKIDLPGIGLLAIGLSCLQTVLERGNRLDWFESPLIVTLTILSAVSLALFVWWELRTPFPAVRLDILRHRAFAAGATYAIVLGFGLYGGVFVLPIFLQEVRGYTATQTGIIMMPSGIMTAICLPFVGKALQKIQPKLLVGIGTLLFAGTMFSMRTITNDTTNDQLLIPLLVRGLALPFMFLPLTMVTLYGLPPQEVPYGTGLYNLMRQLGGSAGIAFLSTVLTHNSTVHRANLIYDINPFNPVAQARMQALTQLFQSKGASAGVAHQQALTILDRAVTGQATVVTFEECFLIIGVSFLFALPLLLLFKKQKPGIPGAAAAH